MRRQGKVWKLVTNAPCEVIKDYTRVGRSALPRQEFSDREKITPFAITFWSRNLTWNVAMDTTTTGASNIAFFLVPNPPEEHRRVSSQIYFFWNTFIQYKPKTLCLLRENLVISRVAFPSRPETPTTPPSTAQIHLLLEKERPCCGATLIWLS